MDVADPQDPAVISISFIFVNFTYVYFVYFFYYHYHYNFSSFHKIINNLFRRKKKSRDARVTQF